MAAPTLRQLEAAAGATGYPAVRLAGRAFDGARGWGELLSLPLAPADRKGLLGQLGRRLLLLTPASRARVAGWCRAKADRPGSREPDPSRRRTAEALQYFGDVEMLVPLLEVLFAVPAVVRDTVVSECVFIGVGWSSRGWTTSPLPAGRRIVALTGEHLDSAKLKRVAAHEIAHAFLLNYDRTSTAQTALTYERLLLQAQKEGWWDKAQGWLEEPERQAKLLALSWGFEEPGWSEK